MAFVSAFALLVLALLPDRTSVAQAQSSAWQIPAAAKTEKSPLKPAPDVLKKGKGLFTSRCQKCHGAAGKGDGPDADSKNKPADLTASKADQNPDGVLFYKVFNGQPPKMPAFKGLMSRDEIWTVVEYAKSLRSAQ
jgi:mono/diheme cytochrome c family protein